VVAGSQSPAPLHELPAPDRQLPDASTASPQQSLGAVSWAWLVPTAAHPHAPSTQRPEQQVWSSSHGAPRGAQVQDPAGEQPPKQQSLSSAHITPKGLQVQPRTTSSRPEQQRVLGTTEGEVTSGGRSVPGGAQTQDPATQRLEPHWRSDEQGSPESPW
jgi:hypothetical protein